MNLGFPYYWFGVKALSATDVVISGFNDSTEEGIIRWSHDGGKTWTSDIVLTTTGWSYRVRFANHKDGLVLDGLATKSANAAHYTTVLDMYASFILVRGFTAESPPSRVISHWQWSQPWPTREANRGKGCFLEA